MATLEINLSKIKQNTANLKKALGGIELVGVTKACAGDVGVAQAMVEGGAEVIADSCLENLELLKRLPVKKMLLRVPLSDEPWHFLKYVDFIMPASLDDIDKLKRYRGKRKIGLVLNIETGFEREGFDPTELRSAVNKIADMADSYYLAGFSTNTACQNGTSPLGQLNRFTNFIHPYIGDSPHSIGQGTAPKFSPLPTSHLPLIISGGNSSVLPWALKKKLPKRINQLRIGEAILLGHDTVKYKPVASNFTDAFKVKAEVVQQSKIKGAHQVILAVGYQDIGAGKIKPSEKGLLKISSVYSEYCKAEINNKVPLGKSVCFQPDYYALLALMSSTRTMKTYATKRQTLISDH